MNAWEEEKTPGWEALSVSGRPAGNNAGRLRQAGLCLSLFVALGSGLEAASPQDLRIVQVKAAIDSGLEGEEMAELRLTRWLCGASRIFQDAFGLRFHLQRFASWSPSSGRQPLPCLMTGFLTEVEAEDADILIGLVSPDRTDSRSPGIASYAHGALLLQDINSDRLMTLVLVHELGHIFGAVDLDSRGSVMSTTGIGMDFDPFTSKIISAHRSRAFGPAASPLADRDLDEALMAYRERAALRLGGVELDLILVRVSSRKAFEFRAGSTPHR